MRIVGIAGFATAGKSEVAKYLEAAYGFKRRHIATTLREMLEVLLRANGIDDIMIYRYLEGDLKETVIPEFGKSGRDMQITIGTEWGRELVNDDIWVNTWARSIRPGERVINDSVRFPNEATSIRERGGIVIKVHRKGVGPIKFVNDAAKTQYEILGSMNGVHPSERVDLITADYDVHNDGTIQDLQTKINLVMTYAGLHPLPLQP